MGQAQMFRSQHEDLLAVVNELSGLLGSKTGENAGEIRHQLSTFAGKVKVHLSMEDQYLYPKLVQSQDVKIRELATGYAQEMGGIRDTLLGYLGRWTTAARIQADPAGFTSETQQLFQVLGQRIQRENNQLYPLLEALEK
jgi:iron-sulfur cluster repair protein YtfE (RIC family)